MPSAAMRPAFLLAVARPCSRRISMAFSKSPSAWVSAFLHSIMPQSVCLRSSITSLAEIAIGCVSFLYKDNGFVRIGRLFSGGLGSGLLGGGVLLALLAFEGGVGHGAGDQLDSADGVVVAG